MTTTDSPKIGVEFAVVFETDGHPHVVDVAGGHVLAGEEADERALSLLWKGRGRLRVRRGGEGGSAEIDGWPHFRRLSCLVSCVCGKKKLKNA